MRRLIAGAVASITVVVGLAAVAPGAGAQDASPSTPPGDALSGPQLTPSVRSVNPGDRIDVIFTDWSARYVTLAVCGNLAKRGSADCNMVESTGVRLATSSGDFAPVQDMVVVAPPTDCPCVLRAVGGDTGEVAVTPIDLIGHPISQVIDPNLGQPVVDVSLSTDAASSGLASSLRGALGGPSPQQATVTVKNLTSDLVSGVAVHGTVRRRGNTMVEFDLQTGEIGPGQTWTGTAEVVLPAPAIGSYDWVVTASGAGPVMETGTTSRTIPWLFVLLLLGFVGVVVAIAVRAVERRRDPSRGLSLARPVDPDEVIDILDRDESPVATSPDWADDATREQEPVGASSGPGQSPW